jgi:thiol-disulfide isomerase/thioredoxin
MRIGTKFASAMIIALAAGAAFADDPVAREGAGQHRTALDQMELKPVPADLWSSLSDWTNGEAISAASIKDKVVIIGTWSSFYTPSQSALTLLQKLSDANAKDGLVVLGVHDSKEWDAGKKLAEGKGVKFLLAHDVNRQFRKTLDVDQDPDFYVIDRAGNLRYADIVTSSVETAVANVLKETPSEAAEAAKVPAKLAADAAKKADQTKDIAGDLKPGQVIEVAFTQPDAASYKKAAWPEKNTSVQNATDVQGSALPAALGNESWITKKANTAGRVVVLDFWATWCGPCKRAMPKLDDLYKANKANLAIIGISDEPQSKVEGFLKEHKHAYFQSVDEKKTVFTALGLTAIPHCVILSSDGIVRWQGNPLDDNFTKAVMTTLNADPGVKARQKAEQEYLSKKAGG